MIRKNPDRMTEAELAALEDSGQITKRANWVALAGLVGLHGGKLESIADAAAAEGKKAKDKIALVLTDLEMPEMDGFTLTSNIKQSPRFKSIPVVIHSSLSGSTNEAHVKSVGADAYVGKFNLEELAAALRKAL